MALAPASPRRRERLAPATTPVRLAGSAANSCNSTAYCANGFVCNAGRCIKPIAAGACTENDDCTSGICGISGTGNCCREICTTGNATCGSTGCDETGACLYPAGNTVCGPSEQSCTGSTQTNASFCDGAGHCDGGTVDCTPFTCGADACQTTCLVSADCVTGLYCDARNATCCADLSPGDTLAVDSLLGDDAVACCGFGNAMPCRSITHAMSLVWAAPSQDTILQLTVDGGAASGDWTAEGEIYPIGLGWGAELNAPGLFFQGPLDAGQFVRPVEAIFEITADAGGESASIVGTAAHPVGIGMNRHGDQLVAFSALWVDPGSTVYLANASVNGNWGDDSYAIHASGSLVLGQDRSGAVTGAVRIGNDLGNPDTDGYTGILCYGCTLSDVPTNGTSTLVITGQRHSHIDAEGSASISLTSAPVIGVAPSSVGFNACLSKVDDIGINVDDAATMSLNHATIQCTAGFGILVGGDEEGTPSLTINDTTIQNTALALEVSAGSAVVSNSTIRYNNAGVVQDDFGSVDLGGGSVGGRNTIACSNGIEGDDPYSDYSVLNENSATLNASNVDWDTSGPDLFSCDSDFSNCTCLIASCTDSSDGGLDAVVIDGGGTILTTGNQLSPLNCAVP